MQYTIGVATGVDVKFLSVGDGSLNGFLDTTNFLLTVDETSTVLSTSYDFPESAAAPAFLEKLCDAYASLGVRGVSVIFAAGDGGVGGGRGGGAQNECTVFVPTFPATCPL
jgi:tripeptidyl-peptidase-1